MRRYLHPAASRAVRSPCSSGGLLHRQTAVAAGPWQLLGHRVTPARRRHADLDAAALVGPRVDHRQPRCPAQQCRTEDRRGVSRHVSTAPAPTVMSADHRVAVGPLLITATPVLSSALARTTLPPRRVDRAARAGHCPRAGRGDVRPTARAQRWPRRSGRALTAVATGDRLARRECADGTSDHFDGRHRSPRLLGMPSPSGTNLAATMLAGRRGQRRIRNEVIAS